MPKSANKSASRGKTAVEIGEGVVRFRAVNDVSVGQRRQAVEFHVAIPIVAADEVVAAARRADERSRCKLERIG